MQKLKSPYIWSKILWFGVFLGFLLYLPHLSPSVVRTEAAEEAKKGDPAAGEKLFFDTEGLGALACSSCHMVNGKGAQIGPDLSKAGEKELDYLRESILNPDAYIVPGFEIVEIKTKDDQSYEGLRKEETDTELKFINIMDPDLKVETLAKEKITSVTPQPGSYMFSFDKLLKEEQINDILAYLQTLK